MSFGPEYDQLLNDFPELQSDDTMYQKEVLAHFGLLFSGYALLEAALHNCFVFWQLRTLLLRRKIRTEEEWLTRYDALERKAFAATFGTLLNLVADCPDLAPHMASLRSLKKKRDYFAHHFFREENSKMFSDESSMRLILAMDRLRREVKQQEDRIDPISFGLLKRMYPKTDIDAKLTVEIERLRRQAGHHPQATFGWEEGS